VSKTGLELIESFEGFRRKAARLPDGRWTIGYGHTLSAREGAEVSPEDAEALLQFDLLPVVEAVNNLVFTPINQNQFDALTAFAFNVGVEEFRDSDVLKRVNEGRLTEAACALDLWRRAEVAGDRIVLDALIRRRAAEKALFLTPTEGFVPTPSPLVRPTADPAAAQLLPRSRPVEIETPLEGVEAHIRRLGPIEPESAVVEAEPVAAAPPALVAERSAPVESALSPPAQQAPAALVAAETPEVSPAPSFTPAEDQVTVQVMAPTVVEPVAPEPVVWPEPVEVEPLPANIEELEELVPGPAVPLGAVPVIVIAPQAVEPAPAAEPEPRQIPEAIEGQAAVVEAETVLQPHEAEAPAASVEPVPEGQPEPPPAPEPAPQPTRFSAIPEASVASRLYASYGPMAIPAMPPRAQLATVDGAPVQRAEPAPVEPAQPVAEPVSTFGPPFVPEAAAFAEIAPEPAVSASAAPMASPLVLTPPPEEPVRPDQPRMHVEPAVSVAAEPDEFSTPLFDDNWDGPQALGGRIVRHEAPPEDETEEGERVDGPVILLGAIGLTAFVGAVAAFLKANAGSGAAGSVFDNKTFLAWALAVMGAACVGASIYFLLKRLGGRED
jgi:lysozyme